MLEKVTAKGEKKQKNIVVKSKENEEISFDVRSYRSYVFRILQW